MCVLWVTFIAKVDLSVQVLIFAPPPPISTHTVAHIDSLLGCCCCFFLSHRLVFFLLSPRCVFIATTGSLFCVLVTATRVVSHYKVMSSTVNAHHLQPFVHFFNPKNHVCAQSLSMYVIVPLSLSAVSKSGAFRSLHL